MMSGNTPSPSPAPSPAAAQHPSPYGTQLITRLPELAELRDEWERLHRESGDPNPFLGPAWQLAWAECFVAAGDLAVVVVRNGKRLIGIAPMYKHYPFGRGSRVCVYEQFGSGLHAGLFELPGVLAAQGKGRRVLREVIGRLAESDWDWLELTTSPTQAWFDPQWAVDAGHVQPAIFLKETRSCVVWPLPSDGNLRVSMKRNLRESLRRGHNRLDRLGVPWRIHAVHDDEPEFLDRLGELADLHGQRATQPGRRKHRNVLADADELRLLHQVAGLRQNNLTLHCLEVEGRTVASLLVTRSGGNGVYFLLSGVSRDWWDFSAVTLLQYDAAEHAVRGGASWVLLGVGVDTAKLRWSETVHAFPTHALRERGVRSRVALQLYWQARAFNQIRREAQYYRQLGKT